MSKLEIDLNAYEGQEIKIKIKNGVAVIESAEKEPEAGKLPEKGYFVTQYATIDEFIGIGVENWNREVHSHLYPRKNHAIIVGQLLAPLLVKQWELTGGYWKKRAHSIVVYSLVDSVWCVYNGFGCDIRPLEFPFPNRELAEQFLRENRPKLNEIARLWQEG